MYLCLATLWLALPTQLQAQWVTHLTREKLDEPDEPGNGGGRRDDALDTRRIETPELHEDARRRPTPTAGATTEKSRWW